MRLFSFVHKFQARETKPLGVPSSEDILCSFVISIFSCVARCLLQSTLYFSMAMITSHVLSAHSAKFL